MKIDKDYDIYCDDEWVAGTNDLDEAVYYAQQYREEGGVKVFEVTKKSVLVLQMSKIKFSKEK
jgi:hypothetical protein